MFMYSDYSQHLLDNVKKIHFIGCGGSGMYPLIQILAAKGYELSGSDVLDGSIIRYPSFFSFSLFSPPCCSF